MKEKSASESHLRIPSDLFREDAPETCSIFSALLDAQLMFKEPGLSREAFEPLWAPYYPDCPLDGRLQALCRRGLVEISSSSIYAVPSDLCFSLAEAMDGFLRNKPFACRRGTWPWANC